MRHHFDNLPPLTPDQANTLVAVLADRGSLVELATSAHLPLGRFLDLLESPEVKAHLAAARRAATRRAETRLAEAGHTAVEVLEQIAEDERHDRTERRRAATTLLRALHGPSTRPRRRRRRIDLERLVAHLDALESGETTSAPTSRASREAGETDDPPPLTSNDHQSPDRDDATSRRRPRVTPLRSERSNGAADPDASHPRPPP